MDKKIFLSAAFGSLWNWLGGVISLIGAVIFFFPGLQPVLNMPALSEIFSPLGLLTIGFFIWLVGFVWNVIKRAKDKENKNKYSEEQLVRSKAKKRGQSTAVGGNNYGSINQTIIDAKQNEKVKNANWRNIIFSPWNKWLGENEVQGGVKIKNNKRESIERCYVEIIEIYDVDGLGLYNIREAVLPRTAGWEIDGKNFYGKTEIDVGKYKYLALTYEKWFVMGVPSFVIGGNNGFQHHVSTGETYFVEIEISGVIGDAPLKPKTKFVTVYFDGRNLTVKDVLNTLSVKR